MSNPSSSELADIVIGGMAMTIGIEDLPDPIATILLQAAGQCQLLSQWSQTCLARCVCRRCSANDVWTACPSPTKLWLAASLGLEEITHIVEDYCFSEYEVGLSSRSTSCKIRHGRTRYLTFGTVVLAAGRTVHSRGVSMQGVHQVFFHILHSHGLNHDGQHSLHH